jgi:predicted ATPase
VPRLRVLAPSSLVRQLDRRLPLLGGGPRDGDPRHHTMDSAIRWSYELLEPSHQHLFRRLSLLADGGCALEMLAEIEESDPSVIMAGLEQLVDKGLAHPLDGDRIGMLQTRHRIRPVRGRGAGGISVRRAWRWT